MSDILDDFRMFLRGEFNWLSIAVPCVSMAISTAAIIITLAKH